jgi:phosphate transport system protein
MERHFQKELDSIMTFLIKLGSIVEENISFSLQALLEQDEVLAQKVFENEGRINTLEIEIDNAIIDVLALQQPVAKDLRFIIAAQKINNDLERIGDHAVNIAESDMHLLKLKPIDSLLELPKMAVTTKLILHQALDSFINMDTKLARIVLKTDDQIDELNRRITSEVIELLKTDKKNIEYGLELIRISRNLERVADIATNIAEEAIFQKEAHLVKHHFEEKWIKDN